MKPTTDRMLNRIKDVYMFILSKGEVTTQDLVEEFNITPRTIQRDLNVLAFNDLVISPSRGKWTTTNKKVKMTSQNILRTFYYEGVDRKAEYLHYYKKNALSSGAFFYFYIYYQLF